MKTYAAIKAEIAKLEKQAEVLRKAEVADVVARIKEAIAAYGLTAADLGVGRGRATTGNALKSSTSKEKSTTVGVAKYRDPKTGKTWTGRGKPPGWIASANNRDRYRIEGQGAEARIRRKTGSTPVKTHAVQIESGVSE
jgi:DNA-binding protein H-NS